MINAVDNRPKLDIPQEVWNVLAENDFVNFSVPLLNPPAVEDGALFWGGHRLYMISESLAYFASHEEAANCMPYDEIFRVVTNERDEAQRALVYAVFFERDEEEWLMMYRLLNVDRCLEASDIALPDDVPRTNWMLSMTGTENWLTVDTYTGRFCPIRGYDARSAAINIHRQLMHCERVEGTPLDAGNARIMHLSGDLVVLVPKLTKGWAVMFDVVSGERLSYFIMDDPAHLVTLFWGLNAKVLFTRSDRACESALLSDAHYFSRAAEAAREQLSCTEAVTAAGFYC